MRPMRLLAAASVIVAFAVAFGVAFPTGIASIDTVDLAGPFSGSELVLTQPAAPLQIAGLRLAVGPKRHNLRAGVVAGNPPGKAVRAGQPTPTTVGPSPETTVAAPSTVAPTNPPTSVAPTNPSTTQAPVAPTTTQAPASTTTRVIAPTSTTSTTTTRPLTTTTSVVNGGIVVRPGADLQRLVNDNPTGTIFRLQAGIYVGQRIAPKDGNQFIGEPGTILDGNQAQSAFAGTAYNVVIQGLIIEDYANAPQNGAIHGSGGNWVLRNNEIRYNATTGAFVPGGSLVTGNYIHHNGQIGLTANGSAVVIDGNEIAFNNHNDAYDMNWEAGGTKFVRTRNLIVRNNYVHDNHGAGLWTDIDNSGTLYEGNTVLNNYGPGILHEISGSAIIRNNRVEGNALRWYTGGILVANSSGVEVYNNTLSGNKGGVIALNDSRDGWLTKNLWVHHNTMAYNVGQTGLFAQANANEIYSSWNNRFDFNAYSNSAVARPFTWTGEKTWDEWRAAGLDPNGSRN